ncbi:MAG: DUF502 domain-containing protein [Pseudomonadota bacterium]
MSRLTQIFLAGLLAALPLLLTVFVTAWVVSLLVDYAGPRSRFGQLLVSLGLSLDAGGVAPYVVGLALVLAAIFVLGLLVESRLGTWVATLVERLIRRIPIVSSLYDLSKRFTSIVDTGGGDNLKSMSAVWCFFGGEPGAAVLCLLPSAKPVLINGQEYVGILVPSAPVPVGGALIYVPPGWIKPAEGGVERLMSVYVSMGVTPPAGTPASAPGGSVRNA